jgi:hypothetical protein
MASIRIADKAMSVVAHYHAQSTVGAGGGAVDGPAISVLIDEGVSIAVKCPNVPVVRCEYRLW